LGLISSRVARNLHLSQIRHDLEIYAHLISSMTGVAAADSAGKTDSLCKALGVSSGIRVTVIAVDGSILGDSHESPLTMENHADRPEIRQALAGHTGSSTRLSPTLQQEMTYVAVPLRDHEQVSGVVRVSMSTALTSQALNSVYVAVGLSSIVIATLTGAAGFVIFHRLRKSLLKVRQGARRLAEGDLSHKLSAPESLEMDELAQTLNLMALQLEERIRTITYQRGEMEAVLSSMIEGVLVFDPEGRVLSMNAAALKLLGVTLPEVRGRSIQEVILNRDFQHFVARVFSERERIEEGLTLRRGAIFVQIQGAPLHDASGRDIGALVVVNDVTRLRRLENLRREFVANVSHELRTPITAIKGFVETLREGGSDPDESARFLDIIARHTDRLNAIIEDLLSLSRLEQDAESGAIQMQSASLKEVIISALQICEHKAIEKSVTCRLETEDESLARINAPMLEQAVVNLLDNAINYSEPGQTVHIGIEKTAAEGIIYVRDEGCGIEEEHIPRLFERFYRVDKTRNRQQGGTGLGLAIVKHITLAHKGNVSVSSTPGQGSTFRIHLPL
jgi:two-component system phosphate regulon sensor histidine kinase PhoR